MSLLALGDVTASYGKTPVLRGVSLEVRPGELWSVLGPNGSGKTTLVRVALGVLKASGQVRVGADEVHALSRKELAQRVAWVPQTADAPLGYSALEVVLMGRYARMGALGLASTHDLEIAQRALDEVGMAQLAERPLSALSGGERRLVFFARALAQQTGLLLLDEPTAFLDVRHQLEVLARLRARVKNGLGALAVLHDLNQAAQFATHALLLSQGKVLAQGPVGDVLTATLLSELYGTPISKAELFAPELR